MSHYDWPLSPVYELPIFPSSSSLGFEPISEIPCYEPTSLSFALNMNMRKARSTVLALLRSQDEPQITTAPKHRLKHARDWMTLRRVVPVLTILLIILTFSYLAVRREPLPEWRYERRDGVVFEELSGMGMGVPTGFAE
ncbi:hypothetical protein I302_100717 [Kwoniella bestiolae CBS 10118]|uniref:Uncharacterized protein n=1 Tax=Kwoniella bestiolae CBS 10118 TaxID=1296100 RepID=A0A1B9G5Y0_9TREE|nr:hypothetical protein I302_04092 [Kwoniella bestiolae CBS 10118]OCF26408.1 hypothetical protein I302_04092 [Kwoniella bestiolae CBS 10118]